MNWTLDEVEMEALFSSEERVHVFYSTKVYMVPLSGS